MSIYIFVRVWILRISNFWVLKLSSIRYYIIFGWNLNRIGFDVYEPKNEQIFFMDLEMLLNSL